MDETGPSTPDDRPHDTHHAHEHRSGPSDVGEHPSTATDVATVWDGRYSSEVWPSDPDALLVKFATASLLVQRWTSGAALGATPCGSPSRGGGLPASTVPPSA